MSSPEKASIEDLARRLRECAESLTSSAEKLKLAAGRQKEYIKKLNELNRQIKKTIMEMQKAGDARRKSGEKPAEPKPILPRGADARPQDRTPDGSAFKFLDLAQLLSEKDRDKRKYPQGGPEMTYVDAMEFSSYAEYLRFKNQPAISDSDIRKSNIDELLWRLIGPDAAS